MAPASARPAESRRWCVSSSLRSVRETCRSAGNAQAVMHQAEVRQRPGARAQRVGVHALERVERDLHLGRSASEARPAARANAVSVSAPGWSTGWSRKTPSRDRRRSPRSPRSRRSPTSSGTSMPAAIAVARGRECAGPRQHHSRVGTRISALGTVEILVEIVERFQIGRDALLPRPNEYLRLADLNHDLDLAIGSRFAAGAVDREPGTVFTLQYDDLRAVRRPRVGSWFARSRYTRERRRALPHAHSNRERNSRITRRANSSRVRSQDDRARVRVCPCRPFARLLGHHHLDELVIVHLAVAVHVGLADHLVHLLVGELLAEVGHHVTQLRGGDSRCRPCRTP